LREEEKRSEEKRRVATRGEERREHGARWEEKETEKEAGKGKEAAPRRLARARSAAWRRRVRHILCPSL
jgi:hypothetical protein